MDSKSVEECGKAAGNAPISGEFRVNSAGVKECPSCGSPDPAKHPAMQFEGEVQPCPNSWHSPRRKPMTPEIREKIRHRIDIGIAHTWDASVLWQHLEAVEKAAKRKMWIGNGQPEFGDAIVNQVASMNNPRRTGYFVRAGERTGRLNPGKFFELTDGKGDFWTISGEAIDAARKEAK